MAGTSPPPRRSSRARTTQSQSQHSSTSSSLSGRPERNTRSFNKTGSPHKSTPTGSLSDEPPDESTASTDETLGKRRRTRAKDEERERVHTKLDTIEMTTEADEIQDDDESVRCICGYEEYPGPPPPDDDKKHGSKDSIDIEPLLAADINDDIAGLFVQCDVCKVWQHGACVGIMSEESSPDEYFCEECRKDLHKICTASNGQRYSHYLPLSRNSRTSSRAGSLVKDGARSRSPKNKETPETRNGRQSSLTQPSKRRSTMNSRDAAYDEEQLRRAIEASKEDTITEAIEGSTRKTKRGRSDSEEKQENVKRQRTNSRSISPTADDAAQQGNPEDLEETTRNRPGSKKSRSAASRTQKDHKEKTEREEREERERQRVEAANKRKGRAERRRADGSTPASTILVRASEAHADTDSDPSEELPLAARAATNRNQPGEKATADSVMTNEAKVETAPPPDVPPSSQPTPDTPPVSTAAQSTSRSKRSHQKKGKGRNQYTKDRDTHDETSPARSQSRDVQGHDHGTPAHHKSGDGSKSHSRSKGGFNSKVSMSDMKRRAAAMSDFISRTQLELAGETTPPTQEEGRRDSIPVTPQIKVNGNSTSSGETKSSGAANGEPNAIVNRTNAPQEFKELTVGEMMDVLTRDLVKWQKEYVT